MDSYSTTKKISLLLYPQCKIVINPFQAYLLLVPSLYYVSIFLVFFCPSTYLLCQNKYSTEHQPNWHFPNPPTQSFCWRNIGMVPFKLTCLLPFFVTFLALRSIDKGCVTNSAQKTPNKMRNLTKIITVNWNLWKILDDKNSICNKGSKS